MREISIKIWLPVIVILFIAVSLAIYFSLPKEEKPLEITISKKETPEIPADWKTYRNEEYGFELRYPGIFFNEIDIKGEKGEYEGSPLILLFKGSGERGGMSVSIIEKKFDPENVFTSDYPTSRPVEVEELDKFKIGDKIGYGWRERDAGLSVLFIQTPLRENILFISFGFLAGADTPENIRPIPEDDNLVSQILSTFRFLE